MADRNKKAVLVISSHVARGSVGNRAAVFALETLAHPVWAIPTITLPWHPGHGLATRIVPSNEQFAQFLKDIANAPWLDELRPILTGYMANAEQAIKAAKLIGKLKQKIPGLIYICDPVIGDEGGLYVPEDTASAIGEHLLPISDHATPNIYELAWLTTSPNPTNLENTLSLAKKLGPQNVLATSVPANAETGNLFVSQSTSYLAKHTKIGNPLNGPGDLTAAIFTGHLLDGMKHDENLRITTASVFEILQHATRRGSNELTLEADSESIVAPTADIDITIL